MKRKITITLTSVLLLAILVSAGALVSNVQDATIKTKPPVASSEDYVGTVSFLRGGKPHTCFLNEKTIDNGDIASCLGCKLNFSNDEIICEVNTTNIQFKGEKLKETSINETKLYHFDTEKLEEKECNAIGKDYDSKLKDKCKEYDTGIGGGVISG